MKDKEHRQKLVIKRAIEEYIKRGDYKLAIEECKKYLNLPGILSKDYLETKRKMADLYEKIKDYNSMIKEYLEITDIYIKEGFASKASPLLKKAINLSPQSEKVIEKMAEVYQTMGWKSEVAKTYLQLIELYAGRKEHYKAVEAYRKLLEIDPGNIQNRVKFIDYLIHIGYTDDAKEELKILLEKFAAVEDKKIIIPLFKKAHSLFPDESLKLVAEGFYANGEYKTGIYVIKSYMEKTGKKREADVFELLAYGFKALGDKEKYLIALRGLLDIYRKQDRKKLRDVYERILEVEPENQEARAFLSKEKGEKEEDILSRPPSLIKSDALSFALTKLDIYVKFPFKGYREKAEEILRSIDILSIEDEFYLDRIMKICEKLEHKELLSLAAYRFAKLYEEKGKRENILKYLNLSLSAWPENTLAKELFSKISPEKKVPMEEEEIVTEVEIEEVPKVTPEIRAEGEETEEKLEIQAEEEGDEFKVTPVEEIKDGEYDLEKALIYSEEIGPEFPKHEEKEEEIKIEMPEYRESVEEEIKIEIPKDLEVPKEEIKIEIPEYREKEEEKVYPKEEIHFEEEKRLEVSAVDSLIKDAEFFKELGDIETLREICNEILKIEPGNPSAMELLKEIEMKSKVPEAFQEEIKVIEREEDKEILQEVLEEFKKKVNEVCSPEDTATHYELGHAYMEMGLWDEAIREFKMSACDPSKRGTCYSLITRCYARKGDMEMAIEYASKAFLEKIDDEGKAMIKKELGDMMRRNGEIASALNYYKEALSLLPKTDDDFMKKEKADLEKILSELEGVKREEVIEEQIAEVKDITAARRKKKIHYM